MKIKAGEVAVHSVLAGHKVNGQLRDVPLGTRIYFIYNVDYELRI